MKRTQLTLSVFNSAGENTGITKKDNIGVFVNGFYMGAYSKIFDTNNKILDSMLANTDDTGSNTEPVTLYNDFVNFDKKEGSV
jgi:hypothetical protein